MSVTFLPTRTMMSMQPCYINKRKKRCLCDINYKTCRMINRKICRQHSLTLRDSRYNHDKVMIRHSFFLSGLFCRTRCKEHQEKAFPYECNIIQLKLKLVLTLKNLHILYFIFPFMIISIHIFCYKKDVMLIVSI